MEICECGNPAEEHHPSWHYAQKRDALMERIDKFMDKVYPEWLMGPTFNRKQVACVAACFILDELQGEKYHDD